VLSSFVNVQEVKTASENIQIQSEKIADTMRQVESAEEMVFGTEQQHRECDENVERLNQRLNVAETKLERLTMERHSLLIYAVVLYTHPVLL